MGKKGRLSGARVEGAGKWSNLAELRDLSSCLKEARQKAYDHNIIEKKRLEQETLQRRRLVFPHLHYLVCDRVRSDAIGSDRNIAHTQEESWYRQHLLLFSKSDVEKYKAERSKIDEAQRIRYYRSLLPAHPSGSVPSLANLCIETAAKFARSYDPEDLRYALSGLPREKTELFSLYCSAYQTQSDELVTALTHPFLEKIYLQSPVSDKGVETLTNAILSTRNGKFQELDSWEQIDTTEINTSSCMDLREISFFSCGVTLKALSLIGEHCLQLRRLCLHDVQFASERSGVDPAVFCLRTLGTLAEGYHMLCRLEMLHCGWVSAEALRLWARSLQLQRQQGNAALPALRSIQITLADSGGAQGGGGMNGRSHRGNSGAQGGGGMNGRSHRGNSGGGELELVEAAQAALLDLCGITLSVTRATAIS